MSHFSLRKSLRRVKGRPFNCRAWIIAVAALALPAIAHAQETAFVKCRWQEGTYPAYIIPFDDEKGSYGIYKIEPTGMWTWSPEWKWDPFFCQSRNMGMGACQTRVTDTEYSYADPVDSGDAGFSTVLTINRMTGAASIHKSQFQHLGLSDDGDQQATRTGTCEKTTDPALSPKPQPKL